MTEIIPIAPACDPTKSEPTGIRELKIAHHAVRWDREFSDEDFEKNSCFGDSKIPTKQPNVELDFNSDVVMINTINGISTQEKYGTQIVSLQPIKNPHMFFKSLWDQPRTRVRVHVRTTALYQEFMNQLFDETADISVCEALTFVYECGKLQKIGVAVEHNDGTSCSFRVSYSRDCLPRLAEQVDAHCEANAARIINFDLPNGDAWYDVADTVFECKESDCVFKKIRDTPRFRHPIIFIQQETSSFFLQNLPKERFVLVSANHVDACAPFGYGTSGGGEGLLKVENLIAWFSTNIAIIHTKLHPLPLGPKIQWHTRYFHGEEDSKVAMWKMLSQNDPKHNFYEFRRPFLIDDKMNIGTADYSVCKMLRPEQSRRSAASHFEMMRKALPSRRLADCPTEQIFPLEKLFMKDEEHLNQARFYNSLRCTQFVAIPEGAGLDTHRFYETLMMGAIPIVINFAPMSKLFEKLPVLAVEKWSDVTQHLLNEHYELLHRNNTKYAWNKLKAKFWTDEILRKANKTH